jgi:squalene-hopene/tetraprenyl-beta-curcumene cyclase
LTKDDPRVKAALGWIQKHYTLSENPGMPGSHADPIDKTQDGLYYYYQSFAKALSALDEDQIVDAKGEKHDWRHDLLAALAERQKPDGSWVNADPRFLENNTNLVTAYALLSLAYAKPAK